MRTLPTHIVTGHSMAPLFRPGDSLHIRRIPFQRIRAGDVVVYRTASEGGGGRRIVHRVVAVLDTGLLTRGDRNPHPDEGLLTEENFDGRVESIERDGRQTPVLGGGAGVFAAGMVRLGRHIERRAARTASLPYRLLRASGLAPLAWKPRLRTLRLETPEGPLVKVLYGNRTVAHWWPISGRYECKKPFDLVIHRPARPDFLPGGGSIPPPG